MTRETRGFEGVRIRFWRLSRWQVAAIAIAAAAILIALTVLALGFLLVAIPIALAAALVYRLVGARSAGRDDRHAPPRARVIEAEYEVIDGGRSDDPSQTAPQGHDTDRR